MFRFVTAAVLLAASVVGQQPYELQTEGDELTLTIGADGLAMVDFVELAQRVTGRAFTFREGALAAVAPVKLVGAVRMKRDDFEQFFQTMLYVKGLATQVRGEGDARVVEIAPLGASRDGPAGVRYVAAKELEGHEADTEAVLTAIPLAHLQPQQAIDRIAPVLAATGTRATLAEADQALLVQGAGAEVYRVWRIVRLIDVSPPAAASVELVALQHATARALAGSLQTLVAGRRPRVVVAGHEDSNSLLIWGPREVVQQLVEVANALDRSPR